jgi:PPOX class probable F420-dependent enzyme
MPLSDSIREFLNEPRFAVLATVGKTGRIQQTVMWYRLEGDTIVMNTAKGRIKANNLDSNPEISICIEDGYRFLTIRGNATVDEDPAKGQFEIREIGSRYVDNDQLDKMYKANWKNEERITIYLPTDHVLANGF